MKTRTILIAVLLLSTYFMSNAKVRTFQDECFWDFEACSSLAEEFLLQDSVLTGAEEPSETSLRQYSQAIRKCASDYFMCRN